MEIYLFSYRAYEEKEMARSRMDANKGTDKIVIVFDQQASLSCSQESSAFYYMSKLNMYNFTIYELNSKKTYCLMWYEGQAKRDWKLHLFVL